MAAISWVVRLAIGSALLSRCDRRLARRYKTAQSQRLFPAFGRASRLSHQGIKIEDW
jgi:hypothetical protein